MNAKIYNGNVQPNPKEFKIWVNDEGIIKTWNGTEWIEQSGGSGESGGSGSGSGSGESDTAIYYKIPVPIFLDSSSNSLLLQQNFFSAARGYYDTQTGYIYGTPSSIKTVIGAKYSSYGYIDAFEFRPIQYFKSSDDMTLTTYNDMESLNEAFPNLFGGVFPRLTAEEYWADYNAE